MLALIRRQAVSRHPCSTMRLISLLTLVVTQACSGDDSVSIKNQDSAIIVAVVEALGDGLQCFDNTMRDTIKIRQNNESLTSPERLPVMVQDFQRKLGESQLRVDELTKEQALFNNKTQQCQKDLQAKSEENKLQLIKVLDVQEKLLESQQEVQKLAVIEIHLNSTVKDLERRLGESQLRVQELTKGQTLFDNQTQKCEVDLQAKSEENNLHLIQVQDLKRRLGESQLRVQELTKEQTILNNKVLDVQEKLLESQQEIQTLSAKDKNLNSTLQVYRRTKDWVSLQRVLNSKLEQKSLAHKQLHSVANDDTHPLWTIGINGYIELAKVLLSGGLPADTLDHDGFNILHGAARGDKLEMAKLLVANGADVMVKDSSGFTALDRAYESGWEMKEYLAEVQKSI